MNKKILVVTVIILSLFFSYNFLVNANTEDPCSSENISQLFTTTVIDNHQTFFKKDEQYNQDILQKSLKDYIEQENLKYFNTSKTNLTNYHQNQSTLFELSILQLFKTYTTLSDLYNRQEQAKSSKQNIWKTELQQNSNYPLISLYIKKYLKKPQDINNNNLIPTIVLGLEANLNYAIFSCQQVRIKDRIKKQNNSIQSIILNQGKEKKERKQQIIDAEKTLFIALKSYDSLLKSYSQHLAYSEVIRSLRKMKAMFKTFEEISSECIIKNHLYPSCSK